MSTAVETGSSPAKSNSNNNSSGGNNNNGNGNLSPNAKGVQRRQLVSTAAPPLLPFTPRPLRSSLSITDKATTTYSRTSLGCIC